ncbi:zinc-dependent alcohol dehydrogenase family protein [Plantactinospora sp. KBS50]|uniref:zinc-dependent alcohol dehydrogenase family protein n=1 Tax=Plantactinospora sp. KBS50 TaxID=2024580 RepID=UPI000BAB0D1E|nr:zinc-dependent alcohol dehydrogenase family protein [Plantactinospora sp. KBS50]ASW53780.1 alcohol dehydrogenase [Plantactinospora sp. KBS50]
MRAVVIAEPGRFGVTRVPDPTPAAGEIVVAPRAAGVCGTDLHIIDGEFPPAPFPLVPGHEFAGEVVALGAGVTGIRTGDRVAVDPSLFCGTCVYCRRQRGNLCQRWGAIGDTVDGAFAEYVAVPAGNAHPVPDSLGWAAAALVEPLSCVVHGLRRLAMAPGSELLIVGAGTIGLLLAQAARRSGAARIAVVDTDPGRRELAASLGADTVAGSVDALLAERDIGFEYAIEATGVPAAAQAALTGLARGGTLLVFGVSPADASVRLSPFQVYNDELTILGSMAVLHTFEPAITLMTSGAIAADRMVTDTFALDDFPDAVRAVRARTGLKVQVA